MSKLMVKDGDIWVPMEGLKGDTGPLPVDDSIPDTALVTDGAKTNTAYLMRNRLTKDAEGEVISVEDAYAVPPVSFGAEGVSTQVTTTGKNLMPNDRSKWSMFRLSSVGSGTVVESGGQSHYYIAVPLEEGQSVHFHRNTQKYGGYAKYCSTYPPEVGASVFGGLTITNYADYTWTNDDGTKPCALILATPNGVTAAELARMDPQLEYGTSFTGYEPYSGGLASPRPDWPQDIESIDEVLLAVHETNQLINFATPFRTGSWFYDANAASNFQPGTDSGVSLSLSDDGNLTIYVGAGWKGATFRSPNLPHGTYRLSFKYTFELSSSTQACGCDICIVDKNNKFRKRYVHTSNGSGNYALSITLSGEEAAVIVTIGTRTGCIGTYTVTQPVLSIGSTVVNYSPYVDVTALIDFSEEPLRSLPDGTKDELHLTYIRPSTREGWAYYRGEKVKRVGCVDMGMLNWAYWYSKFYAVVPNCINQPNINQKLSNYYASGKIVAIAISVDSIDEGVVYSRSTYPNVIIKDTAYTKATEFKEHVSGRMLQYPLATPETIDLGIFELPTMQSGTTHLWSDPSTNLSVTYERDRNIVITNLKAAVADLTTS